MPCAVHSTARFLRGLHRVAVTKEVDSPQRRRKDSAIAPSNGFPTTPSPRTSSALSCDVADPRGRVFGRDSQELSNCCHV